MRRAVLTSAKLALVIVVFLLVAVMGQCSVSTVTQRSGVRLERSLMVQVSGIAGLVLGAYVARRLWLRVR